MSQGKPGKPIGQRILEARERAGLKQVELAERLKVTDPTIWSWEKGRTEPKGNDLDAVLAFLAEHEGPEAE